MDTSRIDGVNGTPRYVQLSLLEILVALVEADRGVHARTRVGLFEQLQGPRVVVRILITGLGREVELRM